MIVKACFENESSLQAKIAFRDLSEVLCSAVFIGQEEQKFFLVLASLNLLFEISLSQKLGLCVLEYSFSLSRRDRDPFLNCKSWGQCVLEFRNLWIVSLDFRKRVRCIDKRYHPCKVEAAPLRQH